jgi:hypothetical protein
MFALEATAAHATPEAAVESAVNACPFVPTGTRTLSVPLLAIKSPLVVVGDSASNAAVCVVSPVPPLAMSIAPVNVCDASHAAAPVALNVPSASVEWLTVKVMPET